MKTLTRHFLHLLTGLLLSTPVLAANLLLNGDFSSTNASEPEALVPPSWTNVGVMEGVLSNAGITPPYQRPGQPDTVNFYDFGGIGRDGVANVGSGIAQTFATVVGRQYRLSFAMSSEFRCRADTSIQNDTNVSVGSLNVTVPVPYVPVAVCNLMQAEADEFKKPWVVKTYTFTASSNSSTLQFVTATVDGMGANDPLITGVEVEEIGPLLTVNKLLSGSGRNNANDQFTVQIKDANSTVVNSTNNSTTQGTGTAVTAGTGTTGATRLLANTNYSLAEVMAPGSASPLSLYTATVSCVNATTGGSNFPSTQSLSQSISMLNGDVVTCSITNSPKVTGLSLSKALGGTGRVSAADQFLLAIRTGGVNGTVVISATTTGAGSTATGSASLNSATAGTAYTLTEAGAMGANLAKYSSTLSCTDSSGIQSGLPNGSVFDPNIGATITPVAGANINCTLTNTPLPSGGITGLVFADVGRGIGVANDGLLNGTEQPLANVRLLLSNCANVVYGQTLTNGQGAYSFNAPNVPVGAPLCVVQSNLPAQVSTGASLGSTALPSGSTVTVAGIPYTYDRALDRLAFSWNGTGHSDLNFGDVPQANFAANGRKTAAPGSTVTYAHTFTAGTAGSVVFTTTGSVATPTLSGWSERIFADPTCSGALQAGAEQLYPPTGLGIAVSAQQKVCIVVQVFVPAQAQMGNLNDLTVQAAFSYSNASPALSTSYSVSDQTLVDNAVLNLYKEVRNVTQGGTFGANNLAKSGDVLEYRITYTNNAPAALTSLTVNDTTPAYTSFVSAVAGTTPASLTACRKNTPANAVPLTSVSCDSSQTPGGAGEVIWRFTGALSAGGNGQVLFRVKVD